MVRALAGDSTITRFFFFRATADSSMRVRMSIVLPIVRGAASPGPFFAHNGQVRGERRGLSPPGSTRRLAPDVHPPSEIDGPLNVFDSKIISRKPRTGNWKLKTAARPTSWCCVRPHTRYNPYFG